jgi:hypothetical protein
MTGENARRYASGILIWSRISQRRDPRTILPFRGKSRCMDANGPETRIMTRLLGISADTSR